jgi:hypothetical protein
MPQPSVAPTSGVRPERRTFRRAAVGLPVLLEAESGSAPGHIVNLSAGGVAVTSELALGEGDELGVYFELPIGYAVDARAEVLRRQDSMTALKFVELSHEAEVALRSFCRLSGLHRIETR